MSQDEAHVAEVSSADDMRADVAAAYTSLKGDAPEPVSAPVSPPADAGSAADASPQPPDRQRDEHGRFAPKVEAAETPSPEPVTDADPIKANVDAPSKAVVAPAGWSAEAKAEFEKLSPVVQAAVLKRESDINDGGARWSEEKRTYETALAPVRDISTRHNVPAAETIKRLAAANEYLERDPAAAIRWLASSYKVDLSALAANPAPTPSQPQADPVVAQLQSELSEIKSWRDQQQQSEINSTLISFSTAKDAGGNAVHPHYADVAKDMGYLMLTAAQTGREITLDQAYEQACWANPDTRAKLLAAQTAPLVAARSQREAADKARRGAISVNGAPSGGAAAVRPPSDPNASVQDDVRAAFAQLRH